MLVDLQDIVDSPREDLAIEIKSWLDLREGVNRANLARHIAALANNAGGYLVFGFRDDLTVDPDQPGDLADYSRDVFSAIVRRYLTPTFQCDVIPVTSAAGRQHVVVRVPSHGSTPVCASASGPHDSRGNPQGILQGTYYIRAPGPESVPISGVAQWQPLIHRCVLYDRDALLSSFNSLLSGRQISPVQRGKSLETWHHTSHEKYIGLLLNLRIREWPVVLAQNFYHLSYRIHQEPEEVLRADEFLQLLTRANVEVRNVVWTGWSMFYPFERQEIRPYVVPEDFDGHDTDVYETNLLTEGRAGLPDFWRITRHGWATLFRPYREDIQAIEYGRDRLEPGAWVDPERLVQEVTELVMHSIAMQRHFRNASRVEFRCSWFGLQGRAFGSFMPGVSWNRRVSNAASRTTSGAWSVLELPNMVPEVVADLTRPVLRLFDHFEVSAEWVREMIPRFRRI